MKKEQSNARQALKNEIVAFGNIRIMVCAALFVALSIIFGKFLQIPNPVQNIIRISFEKFFVYFFTARRTILAQRLLRFTAIWATIRNFYTHDTYEENCK